MISLLFLISSAFSIPTELERAQVQTILRAKKISALNHSLILFQEIETARQNCEARLANKEFPVECYRLARLEESEFGFKNRRRNYRVYDEVCRRAFVLGQDINLTIDLAHVNVSPKCRHYMELAKCKKSYQLGLLGEGCDASR